MINMPDFATWSQANLAKFAGEAYAKLCEQDDYIQQLQCDLKTAIEAYEMVDHVEQERLRIVATLEKIKQDCDSLIMDVNRKFISPE